MLEESAPVKLSLVVNSSREEFKYVVLLGVAVGLFVALVSLLIGKYFINPVFCLSHGGTICGMSGQLGYYVALVLASVLASVFMVNKGVYRPLLIILMSLVAIWVIGNCAHTLMAHSWQTYCLFMMLISCVVYSLFYWLAHWRSFFYSFLSSIGVLAVICWMMF
jgi:hypothetical protein